MTFASPNLVLAPRQLDGVHPEVATVAEQQDEKANLYTPNDVPARRITANKRVLMLKFMTLIFIQS